jgi:hypothetical protein
VLNNALLTVHECRVLCDIYYLLRVPHRAQQLLSSEHTPVASHAIPVYEMLVKTWQSLKLSFPHLSYCIDAGIFKIRSYIVHTRKSQVLTLSMGKCYFFFIQTVYLQYVMPVLHPGMKFDWISRNWSPEESDDARDWLVNSVSY